MVAREPSDVQRQAVEGLANLVQLTPKGAAVATAWSLWANNNNNNTYARTKVPRALRKSPIEANPTVSLWDLGKRHPTHPPSLSP